MKKKKRKAYICKCIVCHKEISGNDICVVEEDRVCIDCVEIAVKQTRGEKKRLYDDDSCYIYIPKN